MHATTNINYNQFNRFETSSDYIAAGQWPQVNVSYHSLEEERTLQQIEVMHVPCVSVHTLSSHSHQNDRARKIVLTDLKLTHQSPVCQLCRDDIGRLVKIPQITPRWEKVKTEKRMLCPYEQ